MLDQAWKVMCLNLNTIIRRKKEKNNNGEDLRMYFDHSRVDWRVCLSMSALYSLPTSQGCDQGRPGHHAGSTWWTATLLDRAVAKLELVEQTLMTSLHPSWYLPVWVVFQLQDVHISLFIETDLRVEISMKDWFPLSYYFVLS